MFGLWGIGGGILLLLFGIFCIFFFPESETHQEKSLAIGGVFIGIVSLAAGAMLVFW
jgi:hypothetical protein